MILSAYIKMVLSEAPPGATINFKICIDAIGDELVVVPKSPNMLKFTVVKK